MSTVTGLIDRGTYWTIQYDDGTADVPKDPNVLDSSAALQRTLKNDAVADQLQAYANHIRKDGKPVDVPTPIGTVMLATIAIVGLGYLLVRKAL
jgi:hypothetical protein